MDISQLITRHAQYRPNHPALIFGGQQFSYAEFNRRVNRTAHLLLGLGLQPGDKVATMLGNSLELVELYWAVAKTGLVIVPLSPLLRGEGLARLVNDSDSVAMFASPDYAPHVDAVRDQLPAIPADRYIVTSGELDGYQAYAALWQAASEDEPPRVEIGSDTPYNIFYSSGTTGLPKGIVHTHAIRALYGSLFANAYRMTPESVLLHVGALIFNGSFLTFMPAFYLGATFIFTDHFDADVTIDLIERHKVTHIKMVPSQIVSLINAETYRPARLSSLEMLGSVGAPLLMKQKERIMAELPGRFYELYGLTEGFMTILDKHDFERKPGSVGTPPPLMELRIVGDDGQDLPPGEIGEIVGRGPMMMPGYYKNPERTAEAIRDGWLFTGDLGYVDEDGFLFLVDRKKDMLISGGVNVYPRDIEEIVVKHAAVKEAAVFGIPDDKWGETPLAAVILHPGAAANPDDIRDWVNDRIEARFQKVSRVVIYADFPRSAAGKTLKREMRRSYWEGSDRDI